METQQKSISQMILDFLAPFFHSLQQTNQTVEVVEGNLIPCWLCTDWDTYKQTLFHLMQNAIKFNNPGGKIKITVSFHTFEDEFKSKSAVENAPLALKAGSGEENEQDEESESPMKQPE